MINLCTAEIYSAVHIFSKESIMDLNKYFITDENELPLENPVTDGGYCGIFRTIACVGDSLSSGEFESKINGVTGYHDYFDYSWGQYLARMAGCKVYNFSRGGMTTKAYCESFADEQDLWNPEKAAQAYIIALGVNDLFSKKVEYGCIDDICPEDYTKNKPTFYGYFGQIISRYKQIQPKAKFFLVTVPDIEDTPENVAATQLQRKAVCEIAELFDYTYVIDLYKYAVRYDASFKKKFMLGWHMNPIGYEFTARMIASYIDYIIRHNPSDFAQVGFIGTEFYNEDAPW